MSEMAVLDVARENADAVSRLIEQYLGAEGGGEDVQAIVKFAQVLWGVIQRTWDSYQVRLDQGMESSQARHAAASASLACDSLLQVVAKLEAAQPGGAIEGLPELLNDAPKVRAIHKAARELVDKLNAPAPPIDESRLAEGLAAARRGDVEDTAAIIARLRTGGEL